ncbi:MAG: mechanosensitive ion channel protein MscS [Bacteroidetes bacterium GWF2_33_16]|nr:MAG: mechanosensitive ion channel protein MscS [Bacteroidetes bacterium GWE2_32_14]OFY02758.1 MAG: mechanosensitive ion channel protein MscS [Bacteroidetes bacterium GWF2_33_16]
MKNFFDITIFSIGDYSVNLYALLILLIIIVSTIFLQIVLKKGIYRIQNVEISKKYLIYKLLQYFIWVVVFLVALQVMGVNISVLLAGSAALLIGLGLGMQNIFSDFVSGIILLLSGTIKVNDVIEVKDMICKVQEINFRTTTVIGRDENYIILPNSELTQNSLINWTHSNVSSRFKITVGIDYSSDIDLVTRVLIESAKKHPAILQEPEPFVRFEDYGDSSLQFSVFFWSNEVFRSEKTKSDIRFEIFKAFKENNIIIPFPQRVVHMNNS